MLFVVGPDVAAGGGGSGFSICTSHFSDRPNTYSLKGSPGRGVTAVAEVDAAVTVEENNDVINASGLGRGRRSTGRNSTGGGGGGGLPRNVDDDGCCFEASASVGSGGSPPTGNSRPHGSTGTGLNGGA